MFTIENKKKSEKPKVVFFTEPREIDVNINILKELLPLMAKNNIRLYMKLHPFDKKSNYDRFDISYIDSLEEALISNICFARKSTTLLEALYNGSKVAAILTNPKDKAIFNTFPSLQSKEITKAFTVNELYNWISNNIHSIKTVD